MWYTFKSPAGPVPGRGNSQVLQTLDAGARGCHVVGGSHLHDNLHQQKALDGPRCLDGHGSGHGSCGAEGGEQPIEQELGGVEWGSRTPRKPSQPENAGI